MERFTRRDAEASSSARHATETCSPSPLVERQLKPALRQGKAVKSQTAEVVLNVKEYFEKEKNAGTTITPLTQVMKRVSEATRLGLTTVKRVCREGTTVDGEKRASPPSTPGKTRQRCSVIGRPDCFALNAIRRKIHSFYLKGMIPTIRKLRTTLLEESRNDQDENTPPVFKGGRESLRLILTKQLGFKYKKTDNRKFLLEKPDVVSLRHNYLRQMRNIDIKKVVFLDETWVNEHHSRSSCWQSTGCYGLKVPPGKGKRLILVHAGTADGFVPNCSLIFSSKSKLADYHDDMDAHVFTKWFTEQLLPELKENTIIVMDNAPYHSKQIDKPPTSKTLKKDMQVWLTEKNIPFNDTMLKAELYTLIKMYKPKHKRYVIDELAASHGHTIVRLPPYHCNFNPIELIWAQVKDYVRKENKTFKLNDLKPLTEDAISRITPCAWTKAVNHVKKEMDYYWDHDGLIETVIEPLIISVNPDSDTDDSSNCSEHEDGSFSDFESSFQPLF